MKIQELEYKTGLERPSIRFYEKEGLLNPRRLENGYRDYSQEDADLLKKIKLLRRLGMSVEKIRALQQGSENLDNAITNLMHYHTSQIDDHRRCRAVCEAMHTDGAAFPTLDADHYLRLLREIRIDNRSLGRSDFQENIPEEIHPWRRFFARTLDYSLWSGILYFVYIVVLRIRPVPEEILSALITIAGMAMFIPIEALMLHFLGTTPGKFALGIRLESIQGGNLTWQEAFERSCNVYVQGAGCCIPLVEPVMKLVRYCQLTGRSLRRFARYDQVEGPQSMLWDEETEIIYTNWDRKCILTGALVLAFSLGLTAVTVLDGIKPKYRGDELTISQFAENYNTYLSFTEEDTEIYEKLQDDGSFHPIPSNTAVIDMNDSRQDHRMSFDYELEGEAIRSVCITHDWDRVFFLAPLSGNALKASMSLLLAQEDCGIREVVEFRNLYQSYLDSKSVSFCYKNLKIEWDIRTELPMHDGMLQSVGNIDQETTTADMYFKITILK